MTFSLDLTVALTEGCPVAAAEGNLRAAADQQLHQPDRQPRGRAVQRSARSARPLALALDRKAFVDIITEGKGKIGGVMLAGPEGSWGMPPEMVATLPGYGADVEKSRAEARKIMEGLGYGPSNPLKVKVSTRNIPLYRDPAVHPDRSAQEDLRRRRARRHRHQRVVRQGRARGILGRHEPDRRGRSTTPTSTSTKTTPAARSATTPSIAIPKSRS